MVGEGVGEFDDVVIEEGGADFEGVALRGAHRGGIDFPEDIAGEVFLLIAEHGEAQGGGVVGEAVLFGEGEPVHDAVAEEGLGQIDGEDFDEAGVLLAGDGRARGGGEAAVAFLFGQGAEGDGFGHEAGEGAPALEEEHGAVAVVAGEEFISAITGEGDGSDLSDGGAELVGGEDGGVGERLAEGGFHEHAECGEDVLIRVDFEALVAAADFFGDGGGEAGFVEAGFGETDGEGGDGVAALGADGLLHERGDDGGIDAAGEEAGDGDVGDELGFDGAGEFCAELFGAGLRVV